MRPMLPVTAYTAVDVETPNYRSDSLCSIGIVHVEYGRVLFEKEYLVNPEAHFDSMNIAIHGITPNMVKNAPTFPEVWSDISRYFTGGLLLAHSATFDLSVICRSLARYGMEIPDLYYICTCRKARRHIEKFEFGNHKLNTLCTGLHIALDHHHNALCDAKACADLFEVLVDKYGADEADIRSYRFAPKKEKMQASISL